MNKKQINQKYLSLHKALGKQKDAPNKEAFDIAHRKIWADCDVELRARKVELETEELEAHLRGEEYDELDELEKMFPTPSEPTTDELRAEEILSHSPDVITQPELWELVRIMGKKLGYKFD